MALESNFSTADESNRSLWSELYHFLFTIVLYWVRSSGVIAWRGQEVEVAEDIISEVMARVWKYAQSAECGAVPPIDSLRRFSIVVARNYYLDLRRRELRLIRLSQLDYSPDKQGNTYELVVDDQVDPSELAVDHVFEESLYPRLARMIVKFPKLQRRALLIHIIHYMDFAEPTPFQLALLEVGIRAQDFEQALSADPAERRRHAANLYYALQRLRKLAYEQPAVSAR